MSVGRKHKEEQMNVYEMTDRQFEKWLEKATPDEIAKILCKEIESGRPVPGVCTKDHHKGISK